ncbi:MAG: hypothetical protein ACKVS6_08780 [Planctomycetota bacterium]
MKRFVAFLFMIAWVHLPAPAAANLYQSSACVLFDGKAVNAAALPETVAKPVRETAAKLEGWSAKNRMLIHVAAGDPLLLVLPSNFAATGQLLTKLRQTRDDFKKRFFDTTADAAFELIYVEKKEAFASYVDLLVERESYLKNWSASVKETAGFWLHQPLASAYFRDPKDPAEKKAEFNLNNQLIHQYAHLLVNATMGRQPYWVQESIAWSLEQAREGLIYAFCHRSGFVFKKEHAGWPKLGKTYLTSGKTIPVEKIFPMERDADIPRELGAASMILTEYLVSKRKDEWLKFTSQLKADLEAKISEPGYKIPLDKQKELFINSFGKDAATALVAKIRELPIK